MESKSEEESIRENENIYVIYDEGGGGAAPHGKEGSSSSYPNPSSENEEVNEGRSSIVVMDERAQLLDPSKKSRVPFLKKHKKCCTLFWISFMILISVNLILLYLFYIRNRVALQIMSLNVWGMPKFFGGLDKEERIGHIAQIVKESNFDLILFEELWMKPDYDTIRAMVDQERPDLHMTEYRDLAQSNCEGTLTPLDCSGLSIISKHPFLQIEFHAYSDHGKASEATQDGEYFARKGVGRVRIQPEGSEATVDVFITHTIADAANNDYTNDDDRVIQVEELMRSYILKSDADLAILGGDFNTPPNNTETAPYGIIRKYMKNSIEEIYYKLLKWLDPTFATYGNKLNSWSNNYDPILYDYIFHRTNNNLTVAYANIFNLPFYHFYKNGTRLSVSDHEAITATIYYKKWKEHFPYF